MPGCLTTAPQAVVIPQPSKQTRSRGALGLTATTETSATTVYWEKVEVPIYYNGLVYRRGQKGRLYTHEVVDGLALDGEAGTLVRHQALSLSRTDRAAEVGLATLTELALAAFYKLIRTSSGTSFDQ